MSSSSLRDGWKSERCAGCGERIQTRGEENDAYREIVAKGAGENGTGTSIFYHKSCAPFGSTSIEDELEKSGGIW